MKVVNLTLTELLEPVTPLVVSSLLEHSLDNFNKFTNGKTLWITTHSVFVDVLESMQKNGAHIFMM